MADEPETFTFVDRRRTAAEDPPPAPAEQAPPAPQVWGEDALQSGARVTGPDGAGAKQETSDGTSSPQTWGAGGASDLPSEDEYAQTGEDGGPPPLDVYSLLAYSISLLEAQAWQCLGLISDPQTGEATPDLPQAKVAIDAVSDLARHLDSAPAGAVPDDLRRDLRTLVSNLRLNYVGQQNRA